MNQNSSMLPVKIRFRFQMKADVEEQQQKMEAGKNKTLASVGINAKEADFQFAPKRRISDCLRLAEDARRPTARPTSRR